MTTRYLPMLAFLFPVVASAAPAQNDSKFPVAHPSDLVKSENNFPQVMEGNSEYLSIGVDEVEKQKYVIVLNETGMVYYCVGDLDASKPSDFACYNLPESRPGERE